MGVERPEADEGVWVLRLVVSGLACGTWLSPFQQKRATSSLKLVKLEGRINSSSGVASSEEGESVVDKDKTEEE